ncbi:cyclin-like protein [Catenaria anguillulae PL171]|uniref:Cyclin-like protein n=1 Tax=Catenaria anguillulae PL171 TaxID=765915 RepID=A0A1Y2HTI4_9FUNG|nr:cyclin-like protein [Catenaria anguillulae PL171]
MGVDQIVARNPRTGRLCLIEDPDEEDIHDPAMCGEYAQEILDYLVTREKIFQPKAYYVTQQGDMSWGMRSVLVDWLFEVHKKFEFLPETMFLAVSLLDRFMSLRQCDIGKFQLVGLTCLFIAAKIEEVNPPQIGTLVYMADNGFAEADMIAAESYILKTLDFDLWAPGPFSFIRRISKADEYDLHNRNLTKYLVEVALMDHRFLAYPMSQIAAGAFFVARAANVFQTSSKTKTVTMAAGEYAAEALEWGVYFVQSSGYCRKELVPIVALFNDFFNVKVPQSVNEWAFFTSKLTHSKRYRDLDLRINAVVAALKLEKECDAVVKQHAEMDAEAMQEARLGAQAAEIKATGGVAPALPNGGRLGVWKPLPVAQIE